MKVAISLPDTIFEEAEVLAAVLKKSRSQLYAEAVADFVHSHDAHNVTRRLNAVYDQAASELDPVLAAAQSSVLTDEAW